MINFYFITINLNVSKSSVIKRGEEPTTTLQLYYSIMLCDVMSIMSINIQLCDEFLSPEYRVCKNNKRTMSVGEKVEKYFY